MKAQEKPGFTLYHNDLRCLAGLSQEQKGNFLDMLWRYSETGTEPETEPLMYALFRIFADKIDRDGEKYKRRCEKNKENVLKRWNEKTDTNLYDGIRSYTTVSEMIPTLPAETEKETVIGNETEKKSGRYKKFKEPTVEEISAYCAERANGIDPERFLAHYQMTGWRTATGAEIRDWKAAVRTWERRRSEGEKQQTVPSAAYDYYAPQPF